MKTYTFGKIDWTGFKSVLDHTIVGAAFALALALVDTLSHHNWGDMQPIVIPLFVFITAFIKKLAETYSVTSTDVPQA